MIYSPRAERCVGYTYFALTILNFYYDDSLGFWDYRELLINCRCAKSRAYRPAEGGEKACNSHRAYTEGEMLAVTKNRTKRVCGWQGSCAVYVDLQAVGALEFFGELYSLAKGFGPFLREFGQALEKGRVRNRQHFALCTGSMGVACPLPSEGVDTPLTKFNYNSWRGPKR